MLRLFLLAAIAAAVVSPQDLGREFGLPLLARVPSPPIPVPANGKHLLVYELHLVADSRPVDLLKLEVLGPGPIATLEGPALAASIRHSSGSGAKSATIAAGHHAVVWMFVTAEKVPPSIRHRITGKAGDDPEPLTMEAGTAPVRGEPVLLQPPLRGDLWVAFNGPSNDTHHRRGWFALGDRAIVPQRFAIDFVRAYSDGKLTRGDGKNNRDHACYGAEVLAVADARVHHVTDGLPDLPPGDENKPSKLTLETIAGNSVVLDLGHGRYATYGHLQPGIRVRTGDRVKAGQLLGLIGNNGNSNGPHLHFHVADGPTLLTGDGIPYVFDFHSPDRFHHHEIPLEDTQMRFPGGKQ